MATTHDNGSVTLTAEEFEEWEDVKKRIDRIEATNNLLLRVSGRDQPRAIKLIRALREMSRDYFIPNNVLAIMDEFPMYEADDETPTPPADAGATEEGRIGGRDEAFISVGRTSCIRRFGEWHCPRNSPGVRERIKRGDHPSPRSAR